MIQILTYSPSHHRRERTGLLQGSRSEPRSVSEICGPPNPYVDLTVRGSALYHHVLEGHYGAKGVRLHEATYWHEQIYGSSGDIRAYLPLLVLGHAAAFEALRIWNHNRSKVDLGSDYNQQREACIAIAIAEGQ